jgi:hypothetical protein
MMIKIKFWWEMINILDKVGLKELCNKIILKSEDLRER